MPATRGALRAKSRRDDQPGGQGPAPYGCVWIEDALDIFDRQIDHILDRIGSLSV